MNTLTKNRILEAGDEYLSGEEWKQVPKEDVGLQIMFTKYAEVRRPSEKPSNNTITLAPPAPKEKPAPKPLSETLPCTTNAPKKLPTVVSKKAHGISKPTVIVSGSHPEEISIPYSDLSAIPNWIGRNGTYKAKAIRLRAMKNGLIQIRPEGKRGLANNALIEFPVSEIPQIVDWLVRQQKPTPTTPK